MLRNFSELVPAKVKVKVAVMSNSLNPMDCSPPGSSVPGILQARILQWVAIPFSRESSQSRVQTQISLIAGGFFTTWAIREECLQSVPWMLILLLIIKNIEHNLHLLQLSGNIQWKWLEDKNYLGWQAKISVMFCMEANLYLNFAIICRKLRETKEPLDESGRGEWKSCLKTQHSKN